ncbi:transportin-1 isoform 1 [Stylonychia lemnae]|uniref:Transportin-1 isoform 1 n=1 Tax=Stylonychia lemnae TaxID=5949 RepID=A0A078A8T9_STYLE|nr:transportin-1 isoform 1 [Stylonychia lemnae]|eukprot:CDW78644.1 transportin-1 isoform 1 [Stylonychia lemnae]
MYCKYLAFILWLNGADGVKPEIRQIVGLTLKSQIEKNFARIPMDTINYVKDRLLVAFYDPEYTVRKTVSSVMSILVVKGGFHIWPELLSFFTQNLTSQDQTIVENSIQAISIIVEDCSQLFENEDYCQEIQNMIPNIFRLLDQNQTAHVKEHSILIVNLLMMTQSAVVCEHQESYAKHLLTMQFDQSTQVRWRIIQGLNVIQGQKNEIIMSIFDQVSELMINALREKDQKIALAATEFWSGIVSQKCNTPQEEEQKIKKIFTKLPVLLVALFECCKFTDHDRMAIMPSKDGDVEYDRKNFNKESQRISDNNNEEDYEIDDDEYFTTLRKSSAFTIERYSKTYHDDTFFILLPYFETAMKSQNPDQIEPAILVLGAISDSDGAYGVIKIHLDNLVPYLLETLNSNNELLRSTTLWTLSKFTDWIAKNDEYIEIYINILCQKMIDQDQNVQEAACASLAVACEQAPDRILQHIQKPLDAFKMVINIYKGNALVLLLDTIGQLALSLGENIRNESIVSQLMQVLNKMYMDCDDESRLIFPLLECFESVIQALGPLSEPFSKPIFDRCLKIIEKFIQKVKADPDAIYTETEFFYVFALLGDSQKHLPDFYIVYLPQFIQIAIENINFGEGPEGDNSNLAQCNNACWFIGQAIDSRNGDLIRPFIPVIAEKVVKILSAQRLNKSLAQNLSVTFGRLGLLEPKDLSVYLDRVLKQWCISMRIIKNGPEKESAFRGICNMIPHNPQAAMNALPYLCHSFVNYKEPPQNLFNIFQGLLFNFKTVVGGQWEEFIIQFPPDLRQSVLEKFNV